MGKGKKWTKEETDFLNDNWGRLSIKTIVKKLGRTQTAIVVRSQRLGLGAFKDGNGVMTLNQLINALGCKQSYSWYTKKLIDKGLPVIEQKIYNKVVRKVDIDKFWEWATKNKDVINWSRVETNILGVEPCWVAERRKVDFHNKSDFSKAWTPIEDQQLKIYTDKGLTYSEIAKKINRTSCAVRRRCYDLYLNYPSKAAKRSWSKEDIEIAIAMRSEGYSYKSIADKLNRSQESVRGKIEWVQNPQYCITRREKRRKQKEEQNA